MIEKNPSASPRWGTTTKTVVAFTFIAILAALLIRMHTIIVPLLLAFIFSYLLHPVASFIDRSPHLSWRASVGIVYVVIVLLLVGLLTLGGVGLVNQVQSLITFVQSSLDELPTFIQTAANWLAGFGLDLSLIDLSSISDQLLSFGQNLLSKTGSLLGSAAGSAAGFIGWTLFVLLVSFFVLAESGGLREGILKVDLPGYSGDVRRLGNELGRIWNAFLRGQIIIFLITVAVYSVVLSILGVRYSFGLALAAGVARFVPYIGPAINWTALALVAFFQPFKLFGMEPLYYTLLVVVIAFLIDQVFDNYVSPRIMADTLRVHPAAVLVAALIAASLLGVVGVIIAAPMLATLKLFGNYTLRKMFDLDPWPPQNEQPQLPLRKNLLVRLQLWWRAILRKFTK